jgi:antirestriction protein ArdC/phage/plasmid primase-like uncharacterized protein
MNDSKPFHVRIAEALIDQLKAGTAPWQRPWADGVPTLPMNPVTGARYRGINTLQLLLQDHSDPRWMTYRQAQQLGAQVRKAERGTSVQYWKFSEEQVERDGAGKPVLDANGDTKKVIVLLERPCVFYATVFNAEQIDGLPALEREPRTWDPNERAETILRNSGARIDHGGDRAFYNLVADSIRLPDQGQFPTASAYYATALHELGHWAGHPSRLDRDLGHPRGSAAYAQEELRAEIASMILGEEVGLGHDPSQHAAYVGFWIESLQSDPLEIFRAAAAAEKIRDHVLTFEQEQQQAQENAAAVRAEGEDERMASQQETRPDRTQRIYITVPYEEREQAKAAGAKWDRSQRSWYVPAGRDLEALKQWIPVEEDPFAIFDKPMAAGEQPAEGAGAENNENVRVPSRVYLAVPYGERGAAKAAGAMWDSAAKSWYVGPNATVARLERWLPERAGAEQLPPMDPRVEFAGALRELGCVIGGDHPIMDGQKHRIAVDGDRRGEHGGFYVGHLDGHPAGYIKNHRTGVEINWKAKGYKLDPAEQAKLRAEAATKRHERAAEQARTYEETAQRLERELSELAPVTFPTAYMQSKSIGTHPGVYTDAERNTYVPATDADGKLWSVQSIDSDGKKRFAKASRKHGCFHAIGGLSRLASADVLVIAEGYATAATVTELLGKPAAAAFDAGNLLPVAQALHAKFPDKPVLIIADDDQAQERERGINPGRQKAHEAARAVGGRVAAPIFAPAEQRDNPKSFSDFNDLAVRSVLGRDGAASQLRHAYEQALHEKVQRVVRIPEQAQQQTRKSARAL